MKSILFNPVVLLLLIQFISSCSESVGKKSVPGNADPLQVEAVVATSKKFENNIIATGNLLPLEQTEIKAPVAGKVMSIEFEEGQPVRKGKILVRLDDRMWKAQLKGLEARLVTAKSNLDRSQQLMKIEGVSKEEVELAWAAVEELQSQIEQLKVNISLARIEAPFDGVIGLRDFSLGSYMNVGQTITNIAQSRQLKADFNLSSRYLSFLERGKEVDVVIGGDTAIATIYAINPVVNASSRTIRIRSIITNNEYNFAPGAFAEVIIPINEEQKSILLPTDVVIPELDGQTVFLYKRGKAKRVPVILGDRNEIEVQIEEGVQEGDTVLTTGLLQLKSELPVEVTVVKELTEIL